MIMKTNSPKKVLIALDYDPTAKNIAESGYALAKSMGAEVMLLHVISDPVFYSSADYSPILGLNGFMDMTPFQLDSVHGLKAASQHFLDKIIQHLGDENITTLINEGDFAESILYTSKHLHADIIVMGSHSHKWLEEILMGSVTQKVLHQTKIPLFIIPTKKHK
jgi:nucleotide-binding universal stress UspA family protein